MSPASVWIVDDLPQTRLWLREALHMAFGDIVIHEAGTLAAIRRAHLEHGSPDLALIDVHLPDGSGVGLIRELRDTRDNAQILVPTIFDDDAHLFAALQAGADGHLLKDQPVDRLAARLRAHAADATPALSPSLARRILRELDAAGVTLADDARGYLQQRARGVAAAEAAALTAINGASLRRVLRQLRDR